jgi:uncharacterized protein YvpB
MLIILGVEVDELRLATVCGKCGINQSQGLAGEPWHCAVR